MAQVARWGNSLAVRIPAKVVKDLALREGDEVELRSAGPRLLELAPDERRAQAMEAMRAFAWKLPADYTFDREEANAR